jgi:hypothetical protein
MKWKPKFVTASINPSTMRSQIVTASQGKRNIGLTPYALDKKAPQKNGKTGTGSALKNKNGTVPASHKSPACISLQKIYKHVL